LDNQVTCYWAFSEKYEDGDLSIYDQGDIQTMKEAFTPLRQNIVLFMAALNGEL
jgi:hypothetical protein